MLHVLNYPKKKKKMPHVKPVKILNLNFSKKKGEGLKR